MSRAGCEREQDVLDAIAASRWPDRLSAELSTHVAECEVCRDLGTIAQTISEDYESAFAQARVPSAGLVWWRAEIRARQQAGRVAARPITCVQVITAVCGIGLAMFLMSWSGVGPLRNIGKTEFWTALANQPFFLPLLYLAAGAFVILTSLALYLALSDE